jgi:TPR repeat protein
MRRANLQRGRSNHLSGESELNMKRDQSFPHYDNLEPEEMREVLKGTTQMAKVLAEHGHLRAQSAVGEAYFRGWGVQRDLAKAAEWHRKAAERGHAASQSVLGCLYLAGEGVEENHAQAVHWLERAAHQGERKAQYALGMMSARGLGIPIDRKRAFLLFRRAATRGLPEAQYEVGITYAEGKIVHIDIHRAAKWFCDGAAQGHGGCQLHLCIMQSMGLTIPSDADLGKYGAIATAEVNPPMNISDKQTEQGEDEDEHEDKGGYISEENATKMMTILENYERAAGKTAQHEVLLEP